MVDFLYSVAEFLYPIIVLLLFLSIPLWIGRKIAKWATKDAPAYEDDGKHGENVIPSQNYMQGRK